MSLRVHLSPPTRSPSESIIRVHPSPSESIRVHPSPSESIRVHPSPGPVPPLGPESNGEPGSRTAGRLSRAGPSRPGPPGYDVHARALERCESVRLGIPQPVAPQAVLILSHVRRGCSSPPLPRADERWQGPSGTGEERRAPRAGWGGDGARDGRGGRARRQAQAAVLMGARLELGRSAVGQDHAQFVRRSSSGEAASCGRLTPHGAPSSPCEGHFNGVIAAFMISPLVGEAGPFAVSGPVLSQPRAPA